MAVSGLLAQYLAVKNQLNYNHQQQIRWNNMATAMSKKLSSQTSLEEKWQSSSEALYDSWGESKAFNAGGTVFQDSNGGGHQYSKALAASLYANAKVPKFDSDLLEEYTELDMEYSTMQSMYDTLCTELEAQEGALKEQLGTEAQDTHLLGGG